MLEFGFHARMQMSQFRFAPDLQERNCVRRGVRVCVCVCARARARTYAQDECVLQGVTPPVAINDELTFRGQQNSTTT